MAFRTPNTFLSNEGNIIVLAFWPAHYRLPKRWHQPILFRSLKTGSSKENNLLSEIFLVQGIQILYVLFLQTDLSYVKWIF